LDLMLLINRLYDSYEAGGNIQGDFTKNSPFYNIKILATHPFS